MIGWNSTNPRTRMAASTRFKRSFSLAVAMFAEFPSWGQLLAKNAGLMSHGASTASLAKPKAAAARPKVYPFIQDTGGGFVCQICKLAVDRGLMKLFPGSGAWVTKPMQNVNSKKWSQRCLKHVRSRTHKLALDSIREYPAIRRLVDHWSCLHLEVNEASRSLGIPAIDYLDLSTYLESPEGEYITKISIKDTGSHLQTPHRVEYIHADSKLRTTIFMFCL